MLLGNILWFDDNTEFYSLTKGKIILREVYEEILTYIKKDNTSSYKISIGTDSQVKTDTVFVTCIHVHRIGKGAIGFLHKSILKRPIKNLREKIYLETCASLQLSCVFDEDKRRGIFQALGNTSASEGIIFEFHIDIGNKGETKNLISEMIGMVKGTSFIPRIKPDSYCASSFADRYTKAI